MKGAESAMEIFLGKISKQDLKLKSLAQHQQLACYLATIWK